MGKKFEMLVRVHRTIKSCLTPAQIECAMIYKDLALNDLYPNDQEKRTYWDEKLSVILNQRAMIITGVLDEEDYDD